ncbi:MAG: hypothetical protein WHS88_07040 [Anaerohalosphaeraceae bacterium]
MKKTYFFLLLCVFSVSALALDVKVMSSMSCRTEGGGYADQNRHDSSKLSVRNTSNGNKSWIKFSGLGSYDLTKVRAAYLTVALHEGKAGANSCKVSAVNDSCVENILWVDHTSLANPEQGIYALTWNNAPGNLTTDLGALDSSKTTYISTITFTDGVAGQAFTVDVTDAVKADTDGIVQFVLHDSPLLINFATHDHATAAWRPYLTLVFPPLGADYPVPADGYDKVPTNLAQLSWTNPEPNVPGQPIYCDVYLGTEPNRLLMDKVTLGNNISSVALTAANFPHFVPLTNYTRYYWVVDCYDPTKGKIEGEMWSFYTNDNQPPYNVSVGSPQATWLVAGTTSVTLIGSAQDDGLPIPPGQLSYLWERTAGPTTAVIVSPNSSSTRVDFTQAGDYTFRLTASDGAESASATVRVVVGNTSCDASHVFYNQPYNPADVNQDCIVNLTDLQTLIVNNWLVCDNTLEPCN